MIEQFGNPQTYKCLKGLMEEFDKLSKFQRANITSIINEFHGLCKKLYKLKDEEIYTYLLETVRKDYDAKFKEIEKNYPVALMSYLRNYISAKFKNLKV